MVKYTCILYLGNGTKNIKVHMDVYILISIELHRYIVYNNI